MRRTLLLSTVIAFGVGVLATMPAQADIVYNGVNTSTGNGFGSQTTVLTLQNTGSESASIVPTSSGFTTTGDVSGNGTEPSKYSTPTLGTLGWTSGSQVALLFNGNETDSSVSIPSGGITLTFYNTANTPIISLTNSQTFNLNGIVLSGQGNAGQLFGLNATEQAEVNNLVFSQSGYANFKIGLAATINGTNAGPEDFAALSPVPLPPAALLLGSGLLGLGLLGRKKKKRGLPSIAA